MRKISNLNRNELVKLINGLKSISEENSTFIDVFLTQAKSELSLKRYQQMVDRTLDFNQLTGLDFDLDKMKRHLKSFCKASFDNTAKAQLIVYAVKVGNQLTIDWGDMGEAFYDEMYCLFTDTLKMVSDLTSDVEEKSELVEILKKVVLETKDVGYSYHDDLADAFYEYFGPYE